MFGSFERVVKDLCGRTGAPFTLERPELPDEVRAIIESGNRIEAVKRYVELSGTDLKEAARVVGQY